MKEAELKHILKTQTFTRSLRREIFNANEQGCWFHLSDSNALPSCSDWVTICISLFFSLLSSIHQLPLPLLCLSVEIYWPVRFLLSFKLSVAGCSSELPETLSRLLSWCPDPSSRQQYVSFATTVPTPASSDSRATHILKPVERTSVKAQLWGRLCTWSCQDRGFTRTSVQRFENARTQKSEMLIRSGLFGEMIALF